MFESQTVLIVDESGYAALDLSDAIEESDGRVAGPVATLADALTILDCTCVCGAIVDCEIAEASDVMMLLARREIPVVVQISGSFWHSLGDLSGRASVLVRPVDPRIILQTLLIEIGRSELRDLNTLVSGLKEV